LAPQLFDASLSLSGPKWAEILLKLVKTCKKNSKLFLLEIAKNDLEQVSLC
jgi:hypothetical protein